MRLRSYGGEACFTRSGLEGAKESVCVRERESVSARESDKERGGGGEGDSEREGQRGIETRSGLGTERRQHPCWEHPRGDAAALGCLLLAAPRSCRRIQIDNVGP